MKNDQLALEAAVQFARIQQILLDCRIVHLRADELARVRLFYAEAGLHPCAHQPHRTMPVSPRACDRNDKAMPLRATA
jgi:hypothetical protein